MLANDRPDRTPDNPQPLGPAPDRVRAAVEVALVGLVVAALTWWAWLVRVMD